MCEQRMEEEEDEVICSKFGFKTLGPLSARLPLIPAANYNNQLLLRVFIR